MRNDKLCVSSPLKISVIVLWWQPASAATSLPYQNKVLCNHNNVKLRNRGTWKFLLSGVTHRTRLPVVFFMSCKRELGRRRAGPQQEAIRRWRRKFLQKFSTNGGKEPRFLPSSAFLGGAFRAYRVRHKFPGIAYYPCSLATSPRRRNRL